MTWAIEAGPDPVRRACPEAESWRRLLIGEVSPGERDVLEDHLDGCEPCVGVMSGLAGPWDRPRREGDRPGLAMGGETLDVLAGMAAKPPKVAAASPANPTGPIVAPEILGLADLEVVGRGGMGVVFRATEVELGRRVAVKVLSAGARLAPSARARAIREAMLMASLKHPNVVPVYRSGEVEGMPYLVMEWVEGGTLQGRIESRTLTTREAARAVRDLALAVAEAHAMGIVHRDLKPENVLIAPSAGTSEGFVPKLTDFGLARRGEHDGVTETGLVIGTPGYMAPEQTGLDPGLGEVGPATDIHGLGAILFACLTGKAPYSGHTSWEAMARSARGTTSIREVRRDVPRDLATIVDKCLQRSPARRYRSAGDLADDLGRFLEGRPIAARPISAVGRAVKWSRRHPALAASIALASGSMVVGVAGTAYHVTSINRNLRDLADEQGRTKRSLEMASRALGSLTDDVVDRMVQRGKALDEADRAFLVKVRGYHEEWPLEPDAEAALRFRIKGLARIGGIFEKVDQYDDALRCHQASLAAVDEAIRRGIAGDWVDESRAEELSALYRLLDRSRRFQEAEVACREGIAALRPLAVRGRGHRSRLARSYSNHSLALGLLGRFAEAEASARLGEAEFEAMGRDGPGDLALRSNEVKFYFNVALMAFRAGRMDLAEARWRKQVELAESARAAFPESPDPLQWEMSGLAGVVDVLEKGRPEEAWPVHRRWIELAKKLVADHPEDKVILGGLVSGAARTFRICAARGRPGDAEADLERAVADGLAMIRAEPAVFDRTIPTMIALSAYCELLEVTGRPQKALENLDRFAAVGDPWTKIQGRTSEVVPHLLFARDRAAGLLSGLGQPAEAANRLALTLEFRGAAERPQVQMRIARLRLAAGDSSGAKAAALAASGSPEAAKEAEGLLAEIDSRAKSP